MAIITAHIDRNSPDELTILNDLERQKCVDIVNSTDDETILSDKTYSVDEAFDNLYNKLEKHYGVDLRKL